MTPKSILAGIVALITGILGIFAYGRKSGSDAVKVKHAEKAAEVQTKATKAIIEGQKRVQEAQHAKVDTSHRTKFERP